MALLAIPFGAVSGVSLGLRGGGGSVLAVPILVYILGLTVRLIAGRGLDVPVTAALTAAAIGGALAGAALAGHLPQRQLSRGFAALVVAVAGYLMISATFLGGPPGSS